MLPGSHILRLFVNPCGPGNTFTVFSRVKSSKIVSRLHGYKIDTFLRGDPPNLLEVLRQPHGLTNSLGSCGPGNTFTVFWRARFPHLFVASFSVHLFEWCNNNEKDYKHMIPSEGRPERVRNYMVVA